MRKYLLQKAESNHLLRHAFPLESVLIPPKLLHPPKYLYPEYYTSSSSLVTLFFPYTPDWPELSAQFPVDTISYKQLAHVHDKTLILGQPGSGKTVLLSALVISMVQDNDEANFPIFLSAKDLLAHIQEEKDALSPLVATYSDNIAQISYSQMQYILKTKINQQQALLLIDDMDHLQQDENEILLNYLKALESSYHFSRIILAADANCIGKELAQQYFPLTLSSWSSVEQNEFVNRFHKAWLDCNFENQTVDHKAIDPGLLSKWIQEETLYYSPFEITLRAWLIMSGMTCGTTNLECLTYWIKLLAIPKEEIEQLALFAYTLIRNNQTSMQLSSVNEYLANQSEAFKIAIPGSPETEPLKAINGKVKIQETFYKSLESYGLLLQDHEGKISFISPIFTGYFGAMLIQDDIKSWFSIQTLKWSAGAQYLRFATLLNFPETLYETIFQNEGQYPFEKTLLLLARIVPDMPPEHPVRNGILKWIAKSAFTKQLPAVEKADLFAALLISRDPSVPKLLLDFLSMPDAELRFLAVLTYGGMAKVENINVFLERLSDGEQTIRNAASLAFYALRSKKSIDILIDILLQGDEYMKQTVSEALAMISPLNKELLSEAITSEELLIRRAAVYGLSRIQDNWAMDMLSRAAIEDGQWIVRNAASQIVENKDIYKTQLIPHLPYPSNAPWLISFAGKQGKGIPKSGFVKDILLSALTQGNVDERISAMNYLRVVPDDDVIRAILMLLMNKNRTLQQASAYSLWYIDKILGHIPLQREKRIS